MKMITLLVSRWRGAAVVKHQRSQPSAPVNEYITVSRSHAEDNLTDQRHGAIPMWTLWVSLQRSVSLKMQRPSPSEVLSEMTARANVKA